MPPKKSKIPHFILNPAAGGGKTGRSQASILTLLEQYFPHGFSLDVTTQSGQATELTRTALRQGAGLVVAVGGDGTMNETLNGFFFKSRLVNKNARLGFLCSGTARDVVRNLNLPETLELQVRNLDSGKHHVDVGRVSFTDASGGRAERYFVNDCQAGIAASVVRRVTPALKKLGGTLAFGIGGALSAMTYRSKVMSVELDGKERIEGRFLGIVVANGRYAGGGMDFAPRSSINDGILDVILIRDQLVPTRLVNFPKIYSGKHVDLPWILYRTARRIRIESARRVELEADGELLGTLPCEISLLPRVLPVAGSTIPVQKKQSRRR
jgi:YegS/Rv2252/BmrU family lipid kinase